MSMQNETTCLSTYDQLLQDFKPIQKISPGKNFFDIVYKKRYEDNISDILVFFLDSNEEHDFGSTILGCLLSAIKKNISNSVSLDIQENISNSVRLAILKDISTSLSLGSYTVGREEITDTGKYIDIVIEGDDWVIAIENKIWAKANNPFNEYKDHIEKKAREIYLFFLNHILAKMTRKIIGLTFYIKVLLKSLKKF